MGTLKQHFVNAIVDEDVTDKDKKHVDNLKQFVKNYSEICIRLPAISNGYVNYMMGWDGSKEGWETSDKYDTIREQFISCFIELKQAPCFIKSIEDSPTKEN